MYIIDAMQALVDNAITLNINVFILILIFIVIFFGNK